MRLFTYLTASAVELSCPALQEPSLGLPGCKPARLPACLLQQQPTYTRNWSGDRLHPFTLLISTSSFCSGSFPCSKFSIVCVVTIVRFVIPIVVNLLSVSLSRASSSGWFLFSLFFPLFSFLNTSLRKRKEREWGNTVPRRPLL